VTAAGRQQSHPVRCMPNTCRSHLPQQWRCRPGHVRGRSVELSPTGSEFHGGVGNTQKDPDRFKTLYDGISEKLFGRLPDATWVYPGHGSDTTIGAERKCGRIGNLLSSSRIFSSHREVPLTI